MSPEANPATVLESALNATWEVPGVAETILMVNALAVSVILSASSKLMAPDEATGYQLSSIL